MVKIMRLIKPIRIDGDVAYITLTKGYEAIIDSDDVKLVENINWYPLVKLNIYARCNIFYPKKKTLLLHRLIINAPDYYQVDHINGNGLDNRKINLRLVTQSQNSCNQRKNIRNTTGFKGVSYHKMTKKYQASIKIDGKLKYLGLFECPELAYKAYCIASKEIHGEYGRLI